MLWASADGGSEVADSDARVEIKLLPVEHSNLLSNYPDAAARLHILRGRITVDARERNLTPAIMPRAGKKGKNKNNLGARISWQERSTVPPSLVLVLSLLVGEDDDEAEVEGGEGGEQEEDHGEAGIVEDFE